MYIKRHDHLTLLSNLVSIRRYIQTNPKMCSLTPTHLFQSFEWPLDNNPINHQNNYLITQNFESLFSNFDPSDHQLHRSNPTMVKKLYHNASERDRRKKVNTLYSSLRSLLPAADQTVRFYFNYVIFIISTLENLITYFMTITEEIKHSSYNFTCAQVHTRA